MFVCISLGENSIVIISGANLLLTEDDVKAAKDIITSASVVVCQLEIKPEVTQAALSIAKKAGGNLRMRRLSKIFIISLCCCMLVYCCLLLLALSFSESNNNYIL